MPDIHVSELIRRGQDIHAAQQAAQDASKAVAAQISGTRPSAPQAPGGELPPQQAQQ